MKNNDMIEYKEGFIFKIKRFFNNLVKSLYTILGY